MDIRQTAAKLASYGRHGDTELVHMAPEELRALEGIGSLTRNPDTGLPEAFSLKSLLPTILGVGATMLGGPLAGAAVSGITEGVQSGDPLRGLMAGALGAGLGSSLGNLGSAGAQAAGEGLGQAGTQAVQQGLTPAMQQSLAGSVLPSPATGAPALTSGMQNLLGGGTMPSLADAATGQALPFTPGQSMLGDLGNRLSEGVQSQYPGFSLENLGANYSARGLQDIPTAAKLATGIGGLGMANYWSQDALRDQQRARERASQQEADAVRARYNRYADLARRVNRGELLPPSFPVL